MARLVLLVGLVLGLGACGGGNDTDTVTVAVTVVETQPGVTATVEAPTSTIDTTTPALTSLTFQMPSKNIGCTTGEGVLVCDILTGLSPEPKRKCELDWTGMEMERLGPAQPRCAGDTAYDLNAPVLEYGASWSRGDFTCVSQTSGVECRNLEDHGFLLSRKAWKQF